jgi:hypothetical protein
MLTEEADVFLVTDPRKVFVLGSDVLGHYGHGGVSVGGHMDALAG